jgi:MtN3 and saliva related transmembrane protein
MDVIGYLAAALTVAAFAPQAYKTMRTRQTRDLSLPTYLVLVSSSTCWVAYGIGLGKPEIYITNTIVGLLAISICAMTIIDDRAARNSLEHPL